MKTALVTGASGGIGKKTAEMLKENGFKVAAHYFSDESSAQLLEKSGIGVFKGDFSKPDDVQNVFENAKKYLGKIEVLINNAGISQKGMAVDTTFEQWQRVININLSSVFLLSKLALNDMMWQGGKIINISSVFGLCGGSCEAAYSASKAGIIGLTKSLAKEYSNVNINCICPGAIDTKMNNNLTDEEKKCLEIPMGRLGTPQEVAELVTFLALKGEYITGQVISVNGGMYI